ncbi:hypothetical protein Tco_1094469 [Tanacetum coccineum]|uniref:Uncharacterized protein n=1 Tax=Tanacetum coccineum TaxID=301880 RepID=A0ABQ5IGX9_9ASTR
MFIDTIHSSWHRASGSEQDAKDALSKLLQMGPVAEYQIASPEVKRSLDANENIGVDEVTSVIDGAFVIGESGVESMEVRSKFGEFLENKESVEEVVVGGGEALRVDEDESNRVILVLKEVVVGGGEALGVDEDESNRVILVLKDGDDEFDDSLDEINQVISVEFMIRVLEGRDVFGEVFSVTPWTSEGGRML